MPPYFPDCFGDFNCDEDTAHDCWCGGSCRLLNMVGVKISRKNLDKIAENGNENEVRE